MELRCVPETRDDRCYRESYRACVVRAARSVEGVCDGLGCGCSIEWGALSVGHRETVWWMALMVWE